MQKERIYICHTYYHVYIAFLKEFALPKEQQGKATLILSTLFTDFERLIDRIRLVSVFEKVYMYQEKTAEDFPELHKYLSTSKCVAKNMIYRMIRTRKLAELQERDLPVNLSRYRDIYVFCDVEPIGSYLNTKHIHYCSVEDGLNSIANFDAARHHDQKWFRTKAFLAKHNLIFIQNGYSKYCDCVEVNKIENLQYPLKKHKAVPRKYLEDRLTDAEKDILIKAFVPETSNLKEQLQHIQAGEKQILLLTEPLFDKESRFRLIKELVEKYEKQGKVIIKQHPRDLLDYESLFPDHVILDRRVPMEILNLLGRDSFDLVISILTDIHGIYFGKEVIRLGEAFLETHPVFCEYS